LRRTETGSERTRKEGWKALETARLRHKAMVRERKRQAEKGNYWGFSLGSPSSTSIGTSIVISFGHAYDGIDHLCIFTGEWKMI
jgi:hypothetical protein